MKESPRSLKIAGVGARSAKVWRAFKLLSRGGSHAAGIMSLGRDRLGLSACELENGFTYKAEGG